MKMNDKAAVDGLYFHAFPENVIMKRSLSTETSFPVHGDIIA